ncbi:MAG: YhgE/Pip domain-containing protein [Actinomycetaceae bacterium]|nr:YhgE/Pip domain-containing protein [Arcanobacterium sp.]MDD7505433.1 YhgE/Pip domain-containing protein [Actinomycetaceae bacterium]MDY6142905.1 YhgE/Pip domain-containing protein [Arcanobacterium sp.]
MREVLRVVKSDLRSAWRSVMALVVISGLVIIPLLFTWFNVLASWDPLGNTGQLKVAVASTDAGFDAEFLPMPMNVGEQVLSALRANDQLDWIITTEDDAIDGAESGKYYAAIVIPESFSQDIMTFYTEGAKPTSITLYTNEKKNALAPKITDQGAHGVCAQIAQSFMTTLSDVSLRIISSIDSYVNSDGAQNIFDDIADRTADVEGQLRSGAQTARAFSSLLSSSTPLIRSAEHIINSVNMSVPQVKVSISIPDDSLDSAIKATAGSYDALEESISELYRNAAQTQNDRQAAVLSVADKVQESIDAYSDLRNVVESDVVPVAPEAGSELLSRLDEVIATQTAVKSGLTSVADAPTLQAPDLSALDNARRAFDELCNSDLPHTLKELQASLDQLRGDLERSGSTIHFDTAALVNSGKSLNDFADSLDAYAATFERLHEEVQTAKVSGDFSQLRALVISDPDVLANMIAAPIQVNRESVFSVTSFGAGMAPLYTTLALWMGSLLTAVTLRTDLGAEDSDGHKAYFGRFAIFAIIGVLQSTLVGLGLIGFVQIEPVHPFLLMLALWVTSLVFMFVVYTLVAVFSNVGKAFGVFLMVIQISASGGAYPLPLLPHWFQNMSPWLPVTYAMRAFRAAVAGVYDYDYLKALLGLMVFVVPALLVSTVFRKPLVRYNKNFTNELTATKLM